MALFLGALHQRDHGGSAFGKGGEGDFLTHIVSFKYLAACDGDLVRRAFFLALNHCGFTRLGEIGQFLRNPAKPSLSYLDHLAIRGFRL